MRVLSLSALLFLSLSACDPAAVGPAGAPGKADAKTTAKTDAPTPGAPTPEAAKPAEPEAAIPPAAANPNALHECLTGCDAAKLSQTDRATCRLNCGPAPGPAAGGPSADGGLGDAAQCFGACHDGKKGDACAQACVTAGAAVPNAPAKAVLEQLGTCVGECYADRTLSSTDRETCKLTCSQVASMAGPGDSKAGGK